MKLTTVISRNALSGGRNGRWFLTFIALLTMAAQTAWAANVSFPTTSGGSGTSDNPYKITSIDDLNKLA
jgi:hypothetical protein